LNIPSEKIDKKTKMQNVSKAKKIRNRR